MASKPERAKKNRTTVPVASRAGARGPGSSGNSGGSAKGLLGRLGKGAKRGPDRLDLAGVVVLIVVVLVILMAIAVPLRNYYQGRSEIARLNESIAAKKLEKERLIGEIEKYRSDDYALQEARRRLGLVEEGETAYRIMDPRMTDADSLTTDKQAEVDSRQWYEVLWASVAEEPKESEVDSQVDREDIENNKGEVSEAVESAIEEARPEPVPGEPAPDAAAPDAPAAGEPAPDAPAAGEPGAPAPGPAN